MTDHSILNQGLPSLPFQDEARLITRVFNFFGAFAPNQIGKAVAARDLTEALDEMTDQQLADLGISRTGIVAYAAKTSGLIQG
ncbi:MAG TPA: hypothetical protein VLN73_02130 [Alphaproteobacteria bacterium]|nr:hypothetical protein [Alphaproteobacteria bacterium]